jgi:hypothetical protein
MTDEEKRERLKRVLESEISRADGGETSDLIANRAMAMRFYNGDPMGDEKPDRSDAISTDVADMVNATLALMVPMISTDAVVQFEPNGEDDELMADAESRAVNAVIIEECGGFIEIQEAVKDALLLRNGCMKVSMREDETVETRDIPPEVEREALAAWVDQAAPNEERSVAKGKATIVTTERRFIVEAVAIERILYQAGYSGDLQRIRFFAEQVDYTRSELRDLGFGAAEVDDLPAFKETNDAVGRARSRTWEPGNTAETRDQDIIECHECYQLIDLDGDGISERYRVLFAGRSQVLDYEQVPLIPYSLGSPFLNAHRITGESLFDHLRATQIVKTKLLRQLLDNVATVNNGRYAYDPDMTSEADVLTPRAGGGIRARNPAQSLVPIPVPDVLSGVLSALAYEDQRRTERGGAALEMLSSDKQLVGETAHGIERQYAAREAMVSMMAKNLSETLIRGIYQLTHEFMRRFASEPVRVRVAGQYQELDPRQWPKRKRCNVTTGLSPGQRGHLQNVLSQNLQLQLAVLQAGGSGVLVDMQSIYRTTQAWLRLASVDNPERFWIDPASPKAQQAAQGQAQQAQAADAKQTQLMQANFELEREKIRSGDRQHQGDLRFKYDELDLKTQLEEAKLTVGGVVDLEKQRMSNARAGQKSVGGGDTGAA